jgi:glycyl-tRNA synthetase
MPFASATIGKSFRNEISPRQGLLRVREFTMCEIEHYVHPDRKQHPRFKEVVDMDLPLYSKQAQLALEGPKMMNIGKAVESGMVDNETLGYFLTRIYTFLIKIGINPEKIRFRQHMDNEMAHYASDCWDAEIESSYGWIECVGCADRSAYDLTCHSQKTGVKLVARDTIPEKVVEIVQVVINKSKFGPKFGKMGKTVAGFLEGIQESELVKLKEELEAKGSFKVTISGTEYEIGKELVEIKKVQKKINVIEYTPNVIEPSFGIGRILYSLLEHCYYVRGDDEQKAVFKFPPAVAPTKALVVPLSKNAEFDPFIKSIVQKLRKSGISNRVDNSSGSIGKRYARNDELGTPFGITIDFDTVKDGSVTLRERDSTKQIRASQDEIVKAIEDLVEERVQWEDLVKKYGEFGANA